MTTDADPKQDSARTFAHKLALALVGLVGVTAFGTAAAGFKAPVWFWLLIAVACGLIVTAGEVGSTSLRSFARERRLAAGALVITVGALVSFLGYRSFRDWPVEAQVAEGPQPGVQSAPEPRGKNPEPETTSPQRDEEPRTARRGDKPRGQPPPTPVPAPVVVPPDPECPVATPLSPSNVRLEEGDLVVAGGTSLYRLDRNMREARIASGDYVGQTVRGVAVERDGQILVSTIACRQGAVVRVDPKTGSQTPLMRGFRVTMGIAVEPEGTVLVADENSGNGEYGRLYRLNLSTREKGVVHVFQTSEAAKGLAIHSSGAVYYASGDVYALDQGKARRLEIDNVRNAQALAITPQGELYVAGYDGGAVVHVKPGVSSPLQLFRGLPTMSTWSLAASRDGRSLFVASGGGESGRVSKLNLADPNNAPAEVWTGRPGGLGVFIATVGALDDAGVR